MTISLCMIVRDEEEVLARCLESASPLVDEIVIVDTGSKDRTMDIAAQFTDKVFTYEWNDDFAAARNESFSHATMDFCMWMDADDMIHPEDMEKLLKIKESLTPEVDAVMVRYNTGFDSAGNVTFSFYRERIVNRSRGYLWHEPVHEYLDRGHHCLRTDAAITHDKQKIAVPGRNLRIYEGLIEAGKTLSPRGAYYYARELFYARRYEEGLAAFKHFLEMPNTWIEDRFQACLLAARCAAHINQNEERMPLLLSSLEMGVPPSEILCEIGSLFIERYDYASARFWYLGALDVQRESEGFQQHDCDDFIPLLQLCLCMDRLGDCAAAEAYNERAALLKPNHPSVLYNRRYFEGRRAQANEPTEAQAENPTSESLKVAAG